MSDKLREAAHDVVAWLSKRAVAGWSESEAGLRITALRKALAATADAPPEPTEEMVRAGVCAVTADTFNQYLTLEDRMSIVRSILRKAALTAQKEEK